MTTYFRNTLYAPVMLILMYAELKTLSDHWVCVIYNKVQIMTFCASK